MIETNPTDKATSEWRFQLNILGLTLLLFAAGYIGKHLTALLTLKGASQVVAHYLGEIVLTAVSLYYAFSRAWGATPGQRFRVAWLERTLLFFYAGLAAVVLNIILLTISIILGVL